MTSFLDLVPPKEKKRMKKRIRSLAKIAKDREGVVGPEKQGEQMRENATLAELHYALETEPVLKEALAKKIEQDIQEYGMSDVLEGSVDGSFEVGVDEDGLCVRSEGNVSEKIRVKPSFTDQYLAQLSA